jgi:hypothetical protein
MRRPGKSFGLKSAAMTFRQLSAKYLEPVSIWLMVLGIVFLCQPWSRFLHVYGVTVTLVGLVGFSIFSKIKPLPEDDQERARR